MQAAVATNQRLVDAFFALSDACFKAETKNAVGKALAYRRAAAGFAGLGFALTPAYCDRVGPGGDLKIEGVGKASRDKARQFLEEGSIRKLEEYNAIIAADMAVEAKKGASAASRKRKRSGSNPPGQRGSLLGFFSSAPKPKRKGGNSGKNHGESAKCSSDVVNLVSSDDESDEKVESGISSNDFAERKCLDSGPKPSHLVSSYSSSASSSFSSSSSSSSSFASSSSISAATASLPSSSLPAATSTSSGTLYSTVASAFHAIANKRGRIFIMSTLTTLFHRILRNANCSHPTDLYNTVLLCGNLEDMSIGHALISRSICDAIGAQRKSLSAAYHRGADAGDADLGDAAALCAARGKGRQTTLSFGSTSQRTPKPLYVGEIVTALQRLSKISGSGSRSARQAILAGLLRRCDNTTLTSSSPAADLGKGNNINDALASRPELRFLVRTMICNLRIHATNVTVLSAVARACATFHANIDEVSKVSPEKLQEAEKAVRLAYARHHDLKSIVETLRIGGIGAIEKIKVQPRIPIDPMLAKPASTIAEVLNSAAGCTCLLEWKYDGVRAQLHLDGSTGAVFSRHLSDVTTKYPDALKLLRRAIASPSVKTAIFDAEIVAVDKVGADRKILPFQQLSTRPRDNRASASSSSSSDSVVQIAVVVFDLMYLNDEDLTSLDLPARRKMLKNVLKPSPGEVEFAQSSVLSVPLHNPVSVESIVSEKLQLAVAGCTEGLMVKMLSRSGACSKSAPPTAVAAQTQVVVREKRYVEVLEEDDFGFPVTVRREVADVVDTLADSHTSSSSSSPGKKKIPPMVMTRPLYEPGRRSDVWRKVKNDYIDGKSVCDSIDVVPIGAWRGSGRKAAWYSPILVAVYDPEEGDFQSLCRVMSGFTDQMYQSIFDAAQDWVVENKPTNVVTKEDCRVWFKPSVVWEIRGADLTVSPKHTAALGIHSGGQADTKGLGLRFPRFRKLRTDKVPTQATSSLQISNFFDQQRT